MNDEQKLNNEIVYLLEFKNKKEKQELIDWLKAKKHCPCGGELEYKLFMCYCKCKDCNKTYTN